MRQSYRLFLPRLPAESTGLGESSADKRGRGRDSAFARIGGGERRAEGGNGGRARGTSYGDQSQRGAHLLAPPAVFSIGRFSSDLFPVPLAPSPDQELERERERE